MCRDAQTDGMEHPMILRFAGAQPGRHANEDTAKILREPTSALDLVERLTRLAGDASTATMPSGFISSIHALYPQQFEKRFGAVEGKVRAWRELRARESTLMMLDEHAIVRGMSTNERFVRPLMRMTSSAGVG